MHVKWAACCSDFLCRKECHDSDAIAKSCRETGVARFSGLRLEKDRWRVYEWYSYADFIAGCICVVCGMLRTGGERRGGSWQKAFGYAYAKMVKTTARNLIGSVRGFGKRWPLHDAAVK